MGMTGCKYLSSSVLVLVVIIIIIIIVVTLLTTTTHGSNCRRQCLPGPRQYSGHLLDSEGHRVDSGDAGWIPVDVEELQIED